MSYTPTAGLGCWPPAPPAFAPALEPGMGIGNTVPRSTRALSFVRRRRRLRAATTYVSDYLEIASIGEVSSTTRTAWQSEVANFWVSTGPQLWNQVYRQMASAPGMDAAQAAHIYMIANLAGADAIIAAWDAKYTYRQWRPVTAIRSPLDDGSAATVSDPGWTSFITTPRFPTISRVMRPTPGRPTSVMTAIVRRASWDDIDHEPHGRERDAHIPGTSTRSRTRSLIARVWGGIHWRTSVVVGRAVGAKVGEVAVRKHERVDSDDDSDRRHR